MENDEGRSQLRGIPFIQLLLHNNVKSKQARVNVLTLTKHEYVAEYVIEPCLVGC